MATSLLAQALGLEAGAIDHETGIATCDAWDSLAHFRVVAAIEERLDRPLLPDEIFDATDFAGVEKLLGSKA